MKINTIMPKVGYFLAIGFSLFLLFVFITGVWIGHEVKNTCQYAQWQYGGNCTEALINQLEDEHQAYRHRNRAIWALGQSGDPNALPTLQKFYTGNIPDREPLNTTISQYELKKAIDLVNGGTNITAILWRHNLD